MIHEWVAEQLEKISVNEVLEPTLPVPEGAYIVGIANDNYKRLYTLHCKTVAQGEQPAQITAKCPREICPHPEKCDHGLWPAIREVNDLARKIMVLREEMFLEITTQFPELTMQDSSSIKIYKGWKVGLEQNSDVIHVIAVGPGMMG